MKSFREVREELDSHAGSGQAEMSCGFCGKRTRVATLNAYGARCFQCYEAYCSAPQLYTDSGNKNDSPKAWAYALKRREESGEKLSSVHQMMWRSALGAQS